MTRYSIFSCFHTLRCVALAVTVALHLLSSSFLDLMAAEPPGITSEQNEKTQSDLEQTRLEMLQILKVHELEFRQAQSALAAVKDARSKAMHQQQLEAMLVRRSRLRVQLAANQLRTDALHAPPNMRKRIDELAKQMTDLKAKSAAEFATHSRDVETIRTVGQLLVAAEHLRRIGKSDAAKRISKEADILEKEFRDDKP